MSEHQEYLTTSQFARAIHISTRTVYRWEEQGIIVPAAHTAGGFRRYTQEQVIEFLESQLTPIDQEDETNGNDTESLHKK